MAYTTLAKINDTYTAQNVSIVDALLRNATIMQRMYWKPASHGNVDKFQLMSTEPTVNEVNDSFGLTSTALSGTLTSLNLAILQSLASEPAVLVNQVPSKNGLTPYETYFLDRQNIYIKKIAKTFENKLIYGTTVTTQFDGLLATATADSKVTDLGADADKGTDIFFWRQEEDNSHGLFNETLVSEGDLVSFKWTPGKGMTQLVSSNVLTGTANNVAEGDTNTTYALSGSSVECYSGVYTSALGAKILASGYVSAITGCDATHKPTLAQIENAMLSINSHLSPAETLIICSPKGYGYIKAALGGTLTRIANDGTNSVSNSIELYNGSPIVISSNVSDAR